MAGSLPCAGSLPLTLAHSRWLTILLSPFTCSPTSFLLTFLLSLVIFISQDIKHSCPLLYSCMSGPSLPLLPHTLFLSFSLCLSLSLLQPPQELGGEGWATQAGSGPREGVGSQGKSFRPGDGQGLGMLAFLGRFQKLLWFMLGQPWCLPLSPEAVDVGPILAGRW